MTTATQLSKRAINVLLSPLGLRVARAPGPSSLSGSGLNDSGQADGQPALTHFPTGPVRLGWSLPSDFPGCEPTAWQNELRTLYCDSGSWPSSISPEGGSLLYWLIRNLQPRTIVETGTCLGASTIWMAAAMQAARTERAKPIQSHEFAADPGGSAGVGYEPMIHTFDDFGAPTDQRLAASEFFQDRERKVRERIDRSGLGSLVRFHVGDSKVNVPAAHAELAGRGGVQFAFIDGDHSPLGAIGDLLAVETVLNVGGYVLLHDVFPQVCAVDGPRELLDRLEEIAPGRYRWCELYTSPLNYGLALLRRVK